MAKWEKKTLKLRDTHGWSARPGCRIFVADKGAVRFDFPMHWIMEPTADCFQFHDRQAPNDECRLAVSYQRLPAIDWSGEPLTDMLCQVIEQDPCGLTPTMTVISIQRPSLRVAWVESNFIDAQEFRQAYACLAIGVGGNIQVLLTFDYWAHDTARYTPVCDDVLESLQIGIDIPDPTRGQGVTDR